MNYLITGSEGFVGQNLTRKLEELGCVFKFNESDLIRGNWTKTLESKVKKSNVIFHVGAISSTDASDVNEVMFKNYEFSKILFDLAQKYRVKVIYSSSAAIYGLGDGIPRNLYAWSKKAAEDYGVVNNNQFVSLRYYNVFGAGEGHKGKMASIAYQSYNQKEFKLFPSKPKRDFVYIKDVISANLAAIDAHNGVYDVGTGISRPFEDVLDILGVKYTYYSSSLIPPWYQFKTQANKDKFLPNWKPEYNLEKALKEYREYLKYE